jgi:hypothetical protein
MFGIQEDAERAKSIFICAASISESIISRINQVADMDAEKTIIFGMFWDSFQNTQLPLYVQGLGWKVGVIEHLHAKLCVIQTPRTWVVYIGSSNLSQAGNTGKNLEFNVRMVFPTLPPAIKNFIRHCMVQANSDLSHELLDSHVVKWKGLP